MIDTNAGKDGNGENMSKEVGDRNELDGSHNDGAEDGGAGLDAGDGVVVENCNTKENGFKNSAGAPGSSAMRKRK